MSKLKERAELEHNPIMSKSPRDCYEKLVRLEYAQAHSTNTPGEPDAPEGNLTDIIPGRNSSPSRGPSLAEIAERAGVPSEAVREELERWQAAGRVSLGEDGSILLLAGNAFPGQGEPEEVDEEPGEPADTPSIEWLEGQSPEVKEHYESELRRVTVIGAAADPQARALELTWIYAQSMNEGGK